MSDLYCIKPLLRDINGDGTNDLVIFTPQQDAQGVWSVRGEITYGGEDRNANGILDIQENHFHDTIDIPANQLTVTLDRDFLVQPNGVEAPALLWISQTAAVQFSAYGEDVTVGGCPIQTTPIAHPESYKAVNVNNHISSR